MIRSEARDGVFCDCQSVELRALCNEVPRTPPGPEGSNGIGSALCAADHPKFLAMENVIRDRWPVTREQRPANAAAIYA